jgi:hypothetical protein
MIKSRLPADEVWRMTGITGSFLPFAAVLPIATWPAKYVQVRSGGLGSFWPIDSSRCIPSMDSPATYSTLPGRTGRYMLVLETSPDHLHPVAGHMRPGLGENSPSRNIGPL